MQKFNRHAVVQMDLGTLLSVIRIQAVYGNDTAQIESVAFNTLRRIRKSTVTFGMLRDDNGAHHGYLIEGQDERGNDLPAVCFYLVREPGDRWFLQTLN